MLAVAFDRLTSVAGFSHNQHVPLPVDNRANTDARHEVVLGHQNTNFRTHGSGHPPMRQLDRYSRYKEDERSMCISGDCTEAPLESSNNQFISFQKNWILFARRGSVTARSATRRAPSLKILIFRAHGSGTVTSTSVPAPGWLSKRNSPPIRWARSRMPIRPKWPPIPANASSV